MFQTWPIVCDAGPTIKQHLCYIVFAGRPLPHPNVFFHEKLLAHRLRRWPSIKTTLVQRLVLCGYPVKKRHGTNNV